MTNKKLITLLCIIAVLTLAVGVAFVGCALPNNGDPDNGNGDNGYTNGGGSGGGTGGGALSPEEQVRIARETLYNIERAMNSPFISNEAAGAAIGFSAVTEAATAVAATTAATSAIPVTPSNVTEARWGWLEGWLIENGAEEISEWHSEQYGLFFELLFLFNARAVLQLIDLVGVDVFNYIYAVDFEGNFYESEFYADFTIIPDKISVWGVCAESNVFYARIIFVEEGRVGSFGLKVWHNSDDDFGFEILDIEEAQRENDFHAFFHYSRENGYANRIMSMQISVGSGNDNVERATFIWILYNQLSLDYFGETETIVALGRNAAAAFLVIADALECQNNNGELKTVSPYKPTLVLNLPINVTGSEISFSVFLEWVENGDIEAVFIETDHVRIILFNSEQDLQISDLPYRYDYRALIPSRAMLDFQLNQIDERLLSNWDGDGEKPLSLLPLLIWSCWQE